MVFVLDTRQRGFTPVLHVTVDGREVAGGFYARLIKATIRDEAGQTADTLTIELDDADNAIALPAPKATIMVAGGYRETGGPVRLGTYELQSVALRGDADAGEVMVLQGSAADLKRKLKGVGREHFEDTTVGDLVERIARRNGLRALVDPTLARIGIPYRARVDISEIDFLTRLADEHDAVAKPMGDRLVMAPRGKATSIGGAGLPPIEIGKSDCVSWEIRPEGRARYGKVKAAYLDQRTGKRVMVEAQTSLKGPDFIVRDPLPGREEAERAARAEARRLTRNTGEGHFRLALGRPEAQAEADVIAGPTFRSGIAGPWRCDAVEHVFDEKGFTTRVEVKAREDGSSGKGKEGAEDDD